MYGCNHRVNLKCSLKPYGKNIFKLFISESTKPFNSKLCWNMHCLSEIKDDSSQVLTWASVGK